jgi:Ras family
MAGTTLVLWDVHVPLVLGRPLMLIKCKQAGQEEYSAMCPQYMRNSQGFAIIYDTTNCNSFDETSLFHTLVMCAKDSDSVLMVLIAQVGPCLRGVPEQRQGPRAFVQVQVYQEECKE